MQFGPNVRAELDSALAVLRLTCLGCATEAHEDNLDRDVLSALLHAFLKVHGACPRTATS